MRNDTTDIEVGQDLLLYKFYLELVFKVAVFVFGITGALVSFFLANAADAVYLRYSLLLPIVMNAGFSALCALGAPSAMRLRDLHRPYELAALPVLLWLFAAIYGIVTIGLLVLLIGIKPC